MSEARYTIAYRASSHVLGLTVGSGLELKGQEMLLLADASGILRIAVPKKLFPHLAVGETAIVTLSAVQASATDAPFILTPEKPN